MEKEKITIGADQFEHLLNCMCNQKFIHEQNEETQKEWQEIIDKSYREARSLLSPPKATGTTEQPSETAAVNSLNYHPNLV